MQVFDTSSIIYAWDNYPQQQFPGLWDWIENQIQENKLAMPIVAFEEVEHKTPDCAEWLKDNNIKLLEISSLIVNDANRIKKLLGIEEDNYHAKGVGENDLFIIATARAHKAELISDEERQALPPQIPAKRKIPSVCSMPEVSVPCIKFIELIKKSNKTFR